MANLSFTEHPAAVGETYFQHMGASASFGARMLMAAGAAFVHAVFPFLCVRTGSSIVTALHDRMVRNPRACRGAGGESLDERQRSADRGGECPGHVANAAAHGVTRRSPVAGLDPPRRCGGARCWPLPYTRPW